MVSLTKGRNYHWIQQENMLVREICQVLSNLIVVCNWPSAFFTTIVLFVIWDFFKLWDVRFHQFVIIIWIETPFKNRVLLQINWHFRFFSTVIAFLSRTFEKIKLVINKHYFFSRNYQIMFVIVCFLFYF